MKLRIGSAAAAIAILMASTTPGAAQVGAPLTVAPVTATTNAVLRTGTPISVRLLQEVTTERKRARVGDRFRLETVDPIQVDGVTVIPVGSPVVGEITEVRNKGMWGKSGHIGARLLHVTVNGRQIRLGGEFDDKGRAGGVGAVAVSAFVFLPAGFFMTGTSARIPPGTIISSFIDEDVPLLFPARTAPDAVAVGGYAPPMVQVAIAAPAAAESGAQARCWRDRTC